MAGELNRAIELGNRSYVAGDLEQARAIMSEAVREWPDSFDLRYNLGVVLRDMDEVEDARAEFEAALRLRTDEAGTLNNLGLLHEMQSRYETSLAFFRAAVSMNPNLANAQFNLAMSLLRLGHFEEGFARFEFRFQTGQVKPVDCPHPRWDGSPVSGTLLIHTEQGAGDSIQFIRFLPLVAERVNRILFVCPPRLMRLFRDVPGISEMRTAGEFPTGSFQTYCPLLSLPMVLGIRVDTIPAERAYLNPPAERVALPAPRVENPVLRVGLSWAGSRTHLNDRNRSCSLEDMACLLDVPGVAFYSLQVDESAAELEPYRDRIADLKDLQVDWADAASLVSQLDLVIAVDTGIVHLSAAVGTDTWIAVSKRCDWRWMLDREDSPWYPAVRLFRQTESRDWAGVFGRMRESLAAMAGENRP